MAVLNKLSQGIIERSSALAKKGLGATKKPKPVIDAIRALQSAPVVSDAAARIAPDGTLTAIGRDSLLTKVEGLQNSADAAATAQRFAADHQSPDLAALAGHRDAMLRKATLDRPLSDRFPVAFSPQNAAVTQALLSGSANGKPVDVLRLLADPKRWGGQNGATRIASALVTLQEHYPTADLYHSVARNGIFQEALDADGPDVAVLLSQALWETSVADVGDNMGAMLEDAAKHVDHLQEKPPGAAEFLKLAFSEAQSAHKEFQPNIDATWPGTTDYNQTSRKMDREFWQGMISSRSRTAFQDAFELIKNLPRQVPSRKVASVSGQTVADLKTLIDTKVKAGDWKLLKGHPATSWSESATSSEVAFQPGPFTIQRKIPGTNKVESIPVLNDNRRGLFDLAARDIHDAVPPQAKP